MITIDDVLYVLLTVALPLVLRYAFQFISLKVADANHAAALDAVFNSVEFVNQTFVKALKREGNFDDEAKQIAFEKAKSAALEVMEASTKRWLTKTFSDLDSWLTIQIESAVKNSKGVESQ